MRKIVTATSKFRATAITGIRSVARGRSGTAATVQTLLTRLLILVVNVATGVITARTLGPQGRGEQAAMILWPQLLAYSMALGLPSALVYSLKRYPRLKAELFSTALIMSIGLGMIALIIGVTGIPYWLSQYSPEVIHYAQWFMFAAPLTLISTISGITMTVQGEFTIPNQASYLSPLLTLVGLGLLVLSHQFSPFTTALAYVIPSIPITLWMLSYHRNLIKLGKWRQFGKFYKRLISYGLRSYGTDIFTTLGAQIDQVLVVGLLSPASLGIYTVALSLSRILNLLQSSIITVLFPKIAARPVTEVVALVGQSTRLSTALTVPITVIVIFLGPPLLQLMYGSEFSEAVNVFRILLIEVLIGGVTLILAHAFLAVDRPEIMSITQGIGLGLSVPLMLILIPTYGIVGAGLSLLFSTMTRLIFVLSGYRLILKVNLPNLVLTKADFNYLKQALKSYS